ncbi:MAG: DUF167 domain-containing protein [Candidatus Magasanikbacteria bacterium]|nr:DUF167 domain-containing protein [Candidatus Magasanikbacteria bacterium]
MRLQIKVVPRAAQEELIGPLPDGSYRARIAAPPIEGQANAALIKLLSKTLKVARGRIRLVRGGRSKNKLVEIT